MIVGRGLGILGAPGIRWKIFTYSLKVNDCGEGSRDIGRSRDSFLLILGAILDAFRKHFGSLGVSWTALVHLWVSWGGPGNPWELQGSIFFDFGGHFGCPWEVNFHVFFITNSRYILKSILGWILSIFLMIFWWFWDDNLIPCWKLRTLEKHQRQLCF